MSPSSIAPATFPLVVSLVTGATVFHVLVGVPFLGAGFGGVFPGAVVALRAAGDGRWAGAGLAPLATTGFLVGEGLGFGDGLSGFLRTSDRS